MSFNISLQSAAKRLRPATRIARILGFRYTVARYIGRRIPRTWINSRCSEATRYQPTEIVPLDLEMLFANMERIFTYTMWHGLNARREGFEYFLPKHLHLLEFFKACDEGKAVGPDNAYLRWMETYHKVSADERAPYDRYYRQCDTREKRIGLCRHYRDIFEDMRDSGVKDPLVTGRMINLPGVYDGGNRLAMLQVLRERTVRCWVNRPTLVLIERFGLLKTQAVRQSHREIRGSR